jgi:hypothetical protein
MQALKLSIAALFLLCASSGLYAQHTDTVSAERAKEEFPVNLLVYSRIIRNTDGSVRVDENIVPNFRINPWLRMEVGLRHGETSGKFNAYNHYKVELQTKSFFRTVRFVARLSDRIVRYTAPVYSNTNYLFIAESKYPVAHSLVALAAVGYVWTSQRNNSLEGLPASSGSKDHFPTYRFGVRYLLEKNGFVEADFGAYDVFNPYPLSSPFTQVAFDHRLSHLCTLYSYFRYQYDKHLNQPLNDFLGLGVIMHFSS